MSLTELIFISIGLAMDAFAVAVCKGLSMKKFSLPQSLLIALFFGFFQGLMPLIGFLLGSNFEQYITAYDHWLAFGLLAFIGGKMIFDSVFSKEEECYCDKFSIKELLILSVATSIDALAVGITFAFLRDNNILLSCSTIAGITFAVAFIGVIIGNVFGAKFKERAEILGGVILILIGTKILLEHLGVLSF